MELNDAVNQMDITESTEKSHQIEPMQYLFILILKQLTFDTQFPWKVLLTRTHPFISDPKTPLYGPPIFS